MQNRPNPRRIPNNFRLQTYIDEELTKAKALENEEKGLDSADWIDIGLTYLEIGDWPAVLKCNDMALSLLDSSPYGHKGRSEIKAAVHYMSATKKREKNDCEGALREYAEALQFAKTPWLKSNIYRNIGITNLKKQDYALAAENFRSAFAYTNQPAFHALRGSLPALSNYHGLALTKAALAANQEPTQGLSILAETTRHYETLFAAKGMGPREQRRCHDFQSHQFHRGMILCQLAEKHCQEAENKESKQDSQADFRKAEELLLGAFMGRIENKADAQRLGDVEVWLGRVMVGLNKPQRAKQYFGQALAHFLNAFPTAAGAQEARQIQEVRAHLAALDRPVLLAPTSYGHSVFSAPAQAPAPQEEDFDCGFKPGFLR